MSVGGATDVYVGGPTGVSVEELGAYLGGATDVPVGGATTVLVGGAKTVPVGGARGVPLSGQGSRLQERYLTRRP